MSPKPLWSWGRWLVVSAALILVGGVAATAATMAAPLQYQASMTYVLTSASGPDDTESAGRTVEALLTGDPLAQAVIASTGVALTTGEFEDGLEVSRPPASAVIEVSFSDPDASQAFTVLQGLDPVFQAQLGSLAETSKEAASRYAIAIWSAPEPEVRAVPRPIIINAVIGCIVGGFVAVAVVAIAWGRYRRMAAADQSEQSAGQTS